MRKLEPRKRRREEKALTTENTEKTEGKESKIFATENEAMDGESLARSEAESPKGYEQDANNKRLKRLGRKDGKDGEKKKV